MRAPLLPQLPSGTASLPLGPAAQSLSAFHGQIRLDLPAPRGIYTPMLLRRLAFLDSCEPCLPSPAATPPAEAGWLHEIKHDGFRMLVRRDADSVRLPQSRPPCLQSSCASMGFLVLASNKGPDRSGHESEPSDYKDDAAGRRCQCK